MKKILFILLMTIIPILSYCQVTATYGVIWGNVTTTIDSVDIIGTNDSVAIYSDYYAFYSSLIYNGDSTEFVGTGTYCTFPRGLRIGNKSNQYIRSIREGNDTIIIFFSNIGFKIGLSP